MLVLTRRLDQSLIIGKDIVVTVVSIRGDKVRLGVTAPLDVPVDRTEIRESKDRGEEPPTRRERGRDWS